MVLNVPLNRSVEITSNLPKAVLFLVEIFSFCTGEQELNNFYDVI